MATILDLFTSKEKEIYGNNAYTYIETRGVVDIPREAALLVSSPNAAADVIGSTVGGLIGAGRAKRPSDTIFASDGIFSKPVTLLAQTKELYKHAADDTTKNYFVKMHPQPALLGTLSSLETKFNSQGAAQSAAINILNKYGGKNNTSILPSAKKWLNGLKANANRGQGYGKQYSIDRTGKSIETDRTYTTHYYDTDSNQYAERKHTASSQGKSAWNQINDKVLQSAFKEEQKGPENLNDLEKSNEFINAPYVLFKVYGKETTPNTNIILPGTITGLSEDITPSVNSFKYIGSPFNLYRYGGVERSLKFSLKMYYTNGNEKVSMVRNLDRLKRMVFPDENISAISYPNGNGYYPLTYNPNILKLTINGLYDDIFVILDNLSISVDDNIPWGSALMGDDGMSTWKLHPTVFDVALSMKIIEHPAIKDNKFVYGTSDQTNNQYANYFTGLDEYQTNYSEMQKRNEIIQLAF